MVSLPEATTSVGVAPAAVQVALPREAKGALGERDRVAVVAVPAG